MERSDALKDMVNVHAANGISVKSSKRMVNEAFPEVFQTHVDCYNMRAVRKNALAMLEDAE